MKLFTASFLILILIISCKKVDSELSSQIIFTKNYSVLTSKKIITHYKDDIENAKAVLLFYQPVYSPILKSEDSTAILALGFPEIIRYNAFSDLIETTANSALYINGGSSASDFSIGLFQMKPSFIENLENYIAENDNAIVSINIIIKKANYKLERKTRLYRLTDYKWQFKYLKVFWQVCEHKFKDLTFKNNIDKLRFYATAYNTGFTKDNNTIFQWQHKKTFPFGSGFNSMPFAFADFSILFYNQKLAINLNHVHL